MTVNERIKLRDELLDSFKKANLLTTSSNRLRLVSKKRLVEAFQSNYKLYDKYRLYIEQFSSEKEALYCLTHITDSSEHLCACGKVLSFYDRCNCYQKTCGCKECKKALIGSDEAKERRKKTNVEKFGVENPFSSDLIKEKIKKINLKNLGVDNPFKRKAIRDSIKKVMLETYGVEYAMQSPDIKNKASDTMLNKYGSKHALQVEEFLDKAKQTSLQRFGVSNAAKSDIVKDKIRSTMNSKYGVNVSTQRNILNYDIWIDDNKFKDFILNRYNDKGSFLLLNEVSPIFNVDPNTIRYKIESLDLTKYFYIQDSNLELDFEAFLKVNNITYKRRYRKMKTHETNIVQEIDFFCKDLNIGFEIDDIASHNSVGVGYYQAKKEDYHLSKTMLAKDYGIRLIHLWEWELRTPKLWNRVSNWILDICNTNKLYIGARECKFKEVSKSDESDFLNQYHLQGYRKSEVCYGLYYNNELIQLMSFGTPRYNKNYKYELLRLCTKYGYSVIGGSNRLLKNFINKHNPKSIISYCNLDKFKGNVYSKLGFELNAIEPQIIWCNKEMQHFSQSSLNWIGADKLIGTNYGKGTNNEEIALKHGYLPIHTCGVAVYTMKL